MNTVNQSSTNESSEVKPGYKQIEMSLSGGRVTALFPVQSNDTDIMEIVRGILISS